MASKGSGKDDKPKRRRRMKEFKLFEVSAVDRPAQEPALALLTKRHDKGKANPVLIDAVVKAYVDYNGTEKEPESFNAVMERMESEAEQQDIMDVMSPAIWALRESLDSIARDADLDSSGKQTKMRESVEEFLAAVRLKWPDVEEELGKFLNHEGEDDMPEKTATELQAQINELTKKLEEVSKSEPDKAQLAEMTAKTEELQKALEESQAAAKKAEEERDAAKADADLRASLTDADKAHIEGLGDDKDAIGKFVKMSAEARAKTIKKAAESDESVEISGRTIYKSKVGEDAFELFKAQAKEIEETNKKVADAEKRAAEERAERQMDGFRKRAETEFDSFAGETDDKAKALKAVEAVEDETVRKTLNEMLVTGHKAIKAAFDSLGHKGGGTKSADGDARKGFEKRIDEVMAGNDKLSRQQAWQQARKDFPDEFKAYQEGGEANTATNL